MTALCWATARHQPMKVVNAWNICLTHDPSYGGLYRAVNDFAAFLPAATLSFDDARRDRADLTTFDGACRVGCGRTPFFRDCIVMPRAAAQQAAAVVADAKLLIVHSMFRGHAPWAAAWARRHRARFWVVPHACLDPWGLARNSVAKTMWLSWYGGLLLGHADRVIFSTHREREKAEPWLARLGARERTAVVPWPVPVPSLADQDAVRARWRSKHGIPLSASVMLFVGRLHTLKRPIETIAAFCHAATPEDRLVMVGMDGDLSLEQVAASVPRSMARQVHVIGGLAGDELRAAWMAGDAFVSLSFRENFGYSAAEALSYGLPVVLSPGHDLAHEMPRSPDGRLACGWLLSDNSPRTAIQAITDCLGAIRRDAVGFRRLGAVGRQWVGDELGSARFTDSLQALARL